MTKWKVEDVVPGRTYETTFWPNAKEGSAHRWRATHLHGRRAPKVVLCDDPKVKPGIPCVVKVKSVDKPDRTDRGMIEVELLEQRPVKIEGVYLDPVVSKKLQILLESGLHILLDGPQGCGKTVLAKAIAKALGLEFVFFNCSAVVEATDFLATIQVRASSTGAPVTAFVKTELLLALEAAHARPDQRFLVFLDEFNRCQESARNVLMPALDSTRKVFDPTTATFLEIPDNVQFIAAVNRGAEFSGTFGIDAAQLDRFAPLQMDYLPKDEEAKLLARRHPEVPRSVLDLVVEIADRVRRSDELPSGLSVRATEEACIYLKHPILDGQQRQMLGEVLKSSFCGRFTGRWDDVSSDAGAVWAIVESTIKEKSR